MLRIHNISLVRGQIGMSTCRYPFGDPLEEDFHFCGEPTHKPGASYCAKHHELCYLSGERLREVIKERKKLKIEMESKKKSKFIFRDTE